MPNTAIFLLVICDSLASREMLAASHVHAHSWTRMPLSANGTGACKALPMGSAVVGLTPGTGPAQGADSSNRFDRLCGVREAIIAGLGDEPFEECLQVLVGVRQLRDRRGDVLLQHVHGRVPRVGLAAGDHFVE